MSLADPAAFARAVLGTLGGLAKTRAMYQRDKAPYQFERGETIVVSIAEVVYADLRGRAAEQDTGVARLSADMLAVATGHLELVRGSDLEMLCLPAVPARISDWGIAHTCAGTRIRTAVCVAEPVYADLSGCAAEHTCDAG